MRTFLHLPRRELAEGYLFFAAALLLGLLPYALAPLAGGLPGELAAARQLIAQAMVVLFLVGASLLRGAHWLAAGFRGRRAFELALPVSALALCASKLTASAIFILGGGWLATMPTGMTALHIDRGLFETLLPRSLRLDPEAAWRSYLLLSGIAAGDPAWLAFLKMTLLVATTTLILLVATQMVTLAVIDPGWTSLADLGALCVFSGLLFGSYWYCYSSDAPGVWLYWLPTFGLALVVLGGLAAWQSFRAGSQLGHAHRRHALVFDLGLLALGYLGIATIHAELRPNPSRIASFSVAVPSADFSRWLLSGVQSPADFEPMMVVDPAKGTTIYLGPRRLTRGQPWLSPDGKTAFVGRFGTVSIYEVGDSWLFKRSYSANLGRPDDGADRKGSEDPSGFEPIGQIRPGVLLKGAIQGRPASYEDWLAGIRADPERRLRTLVVDLESGRVLRQLDGFLPVKNPVAPSQIWLVDKNLAPYDLENPAAEPRPYLPWRAR